MKISKELELLIWKKEKAELDIINYLSHKGWPKNLTKVAWPTLYDEYLRCKSRAKEITWDEFLMSANLI